MVKISNLPPDPATAPPPEPSREPENISQRAPANNNDNDTLEPRSSTPAHPSPTAAQNPEQTSRSKSIEEDSTLRDLGYPRGLPKSEEAITRFLLQKQKKQSTLLHRLRLATGSKKAKTLKVAFKAAKDGTITSLFPESCYNGELFTVGNTRMSRRDIKTTIKVVKTMESVLISVLKKELHTLPTKPTNPSNRRILREITLPDGTEKTITARLKGDSIASVKPRVLTQAERSTFLHLAHGLPRSRALPGTTGYRKQSFKADLIHLLSGRNPVELYQLRQLLPIQESGSRAPLNPESSTKPEPTFTGHTSMELLKLATDLGVFKK